MFHATEAHLEEANAPVTSEGVKNCDTCAGKRRKIGVNAYRLDRPRGAIVNGAEFPREGHPISTYLIELLDHGGNVRVADWISCDDDADAINRAQAMDVVRIGIGYDVWEGSRLVFRHRRGRQPLFP